MGVCPQYDILFNDLIAKEHIELYAGIKNISSIKIVKLVKKHLAALHEPTTGIDPVNRCYVWSFIENFKQDRIIILTTHSMEKANVLGNRICVMAHDHLCALGNSMYIKNKFGTSYHISLVSHPNDLQHLKELVETQVPAAKLKDNSAGSLIYKLPLSALPILSSFI
ncbi:hypothetical protein C2G38_2210416 [Gigaspora rosea]|uniref:P-loop containing nucleoside triphosphate hydrolase protein n=1 Tax=Gigaspora rosea TaxID=44941 RepID=A0A397UP54_9GLOM|nr:hypothetical protein C2G38_2210416 [Gigaspora rosea]